MTEDIITRIIELEWTMFQGVSNAGGRAACQDDRPTFEIMRRSQAAAWSEAVLASYLDDLLEAEEQGRNLMMEKYAHMMKSTAPLEYARVARLLPPVSPEALPLIDRIAAIVVDWEEELSRKYPHLVERGRPIRSSSDSPLATSLETYLKGELSTYSLQTLKLYHEHVLGQKSNHINGSEITLAQTIKHYGFNSLEEADAKLRSERMS